MPDRAEVQPVELMTARASTLFEGVGTAPPAMTRLEPMSVSGDPRYGAEAAIADPLWLLARQWQFGELTGEDAGSPVSVAVRHRSLPLTAWAPAGDGAPDTPPWQAWPAGAALDEVVQAVPRSAVDRGLRRRVELGSELADALAGQPDVLAALIDTYPLAAERSAVVDAAAARLLLALADSVPDGSAVLDALAAGEPAWLTGAANPDAVRSAIEPWREWATPPPGGGAFVTERLEYRFWLRFGHGDDAAVFRVDGFGGGALRWHHLTWVPDAVVTLPGDADLDEPDEITNVMLATPLRYPGMPADRYWQLENGAVDVASIEAQPQDLARLCLAEFALTTGDDWLLVPVDAGPGAVTQILDVTVTNTFGESVSVPPAAAARRAAGFRMFEVDADDGSVFPGLVLPPVAATPLVGDPVEEVAFLRDEAANLAWAVERIVPGASGDPMLQTAPAAAPAPAAPGADDDPADLVWTFTSPVPANWIPLVPVSTGPAQVALRKGAMTDETGTAVAARSELLAPTPLTFPAEEIPREGVIVAAVPMLARRADGSYARWTAHRIQVGRGEGRSGFVSDAADPRSG